MPPPVALDWSLIWPTPATYQLVSLAMMGADCVLFLTVASMLVVCLRALANVPAGTSTVSIAASVMVCVRSSVTGLLLVSVPYARFWPTTFETCPSPTGNSSCT